LLPGLPESSASWAIVGARAISLSGSMPRPLRPGISRSRGPCGSRPRWAAPCRAPGRPRRWRRTSPPRGTRCASPSAPAGPRRSGTPPGGTARSAGWRRAPGRPRAEWPAARCRTRWRGFRDCRLETPEGHLYYLRVLCGAGGIFAGGVAAIRMLAPAGPPIPKTAEAGARARRLPGSSHDQPDGSRHPDDRPFRQ